MPIFLNTVSPVRFLGVNWEWVDDSYNNNNAIIVLEKRREEIGNFLQSICLELHPEKTYIRGVNDGTPFLGFKVFYFYKTVLSRNRKRFIRQLNELDKSYQKGEITIQDLKNSINSWIAYAKYGNSYNLRKKILSHYVFTRK